MDIYLVGGAVRDILLGRPASDKDFLVTGADRETFMRAFPEAQEVGKAFPVFLVDGVEFTFPRATDLEGDLLARDFTINAAAIDKNGNLICHPDFLEDIRNRQLRPCSPDSLREDPLRVFRAARFLCQLPNFSAHPVLLQMMCETAASGLLDNLADHRVGTELRKALSAPVPGNFLRVLHQGGCLSPWFHEFSRAAHIPAGPPEHHDSSVLEHTCATMDKLAQTDPLFVWMALTHDLGKTGTPEQEWPRHIGHEIRGEAMAQALARRLALPNDYVFAGKKAALWHMKAARYPELRPGTRVDLLMAMKTEAELEGVFRLAEADGGPDSLGRAKEELKEILQVSLDPSDYNKGPKSGEKLRSLRAQAIS